MAKETRYQGKRQPIRRTLSPNPENRIGPKKAGVDIPPDELNQIKGPIRPPRWKAKRTFVGKLMIQVRPPPRGETQVSMKVTLVRAHRPRKAERTHVELTEIAHNLKKGVAFDAVPAGDYAIICQPKGYRPFVRFVQFTRRTPAFQLASPLHPVRSPEEEEVLLRDGERHPFIENTRQIGRAHV